MLTLDAIPAHQSVRLVKFTQPKGPFRQKLLAMGLTPGVTLKVLRVAPLGDPIQIAVRGYTLSLRKRDCQQLLVAPIAEAVPC